MLPAAKVQLVSSAVGIQITCISDTNQHYVRHTNFRTDLSTKTSLMFTDVLSVFAKIARAVKAHNPSNSPHYVDFYVFSDTNAK